MNTCIKCNINYKSSYQGAKPVCSPCRKYFIQNAIYNINYNQVAKGGSNLATKHTKKMGSDAEIKFAEVIKNKYLYKLRRSTKHEEIKLHYDYVIEKNNSDYLRIEVKAMKSRRRGKPVDPTIIYLEYKNIIGGPGWLYGKSDYIAFEQPNSFILVFRNDLVEFGNKMLPKMKLVNKSGIEGTLYSRRNREDLVGCFDLSDIITNNKHFILNK